MDTESSQQETAVAQLAVDFWKLLRVCERIALTLPDERRKRIEAQLRFSAGRLESHLETLDLELHSYEGSQFGPELPAIAVNPDDFVNAENLVVESAVEPAVILQGRLLQSARVTLKEGSADVSGN